ncbi:MAG: pirin family protein [Acidiferrobacter sp.]
MIRVRAAADRGHADHGWLRSAHSFSFADYYDPHAMGFSDLRVLNEDFIAGGGGFPPHPHRDMEILTFVMQGALRHEDSLGNGSVIRAGDVQRISAGTGVVHSEANAAADEPVHLLQIWLQPDRRGLLPEYEQRTMPARARHGRWQLLASGQAAEDALHWHQDARLWAAVVSADGPLTYAFGTDRAGYLQVVSGTVTVNGHPCAVGDGAQIAPATHLTCTATDAPELLLFDLRAP